MKGVIVTVDSNEITHHPEFLKMDLDGCLVVGGKLQAGDFRINKPDGSIVLIERKSPRDLLESIRDRRLFNQMADMLEVTKWSYLLVNGHLRQSPEGNVDYSRRGVWEKTMWTWGSIQGSLLSLQELGALILYDVHVPDAIRRIVKRSQSNVKIEQRRKSHIYSKDESVLMAIPGIGGSKAHDIMMHFPTPGYALEWLTNERHEEPKIKGISNATKRKIINFFGGNIVLEV